MEQDLVTIIVPVYKVEKYIDKCIKSVIEQTYEKIEIILVDDGSPDNCGQICDEYAKKDKRIKVIHKQNGGLSDARNKGIEIATGRYIYFLDSDDYIEKDTIEYLYELCQKYKADITIGTTKLVYKNKEKDFSMIKQPAQKEEKVYSMIEALETMLYNAEFTNNAWNKLYKASLFQEVRYPVGKLYEDLGTTYKLILQSKKIVLGNQYSYYYVVDRNDSIMNEKFNPKRMDGLEFAEEMLEYITNHLSEIQDAAISRLYMECIFILLKLPNKKEFEKENKKVIYYLRKYRKNILQNKKMPKKQKLLALVVIFGRIPLRMVWNIKEYRKSKKK